MKQQSQSSITAAMVQPDELCPHVELGVEMAGGVLFNAENPPIAVGMCRDCIDWSGVNLDSLVPLNAESTKKRNMKQQPSQSTSPTTHDHKWHPTGEAFMSNPPIYVYHCKCGELGQKQERELEMAIKGNDPDYRFCDECRKLPPPSSSVTAALSTIGDWDAVEKMIEQYIVDARLNFAQRQLLIPIRDFIFIRTTLGADWPKDTDERS